MSSSDAADEDADVERCVDDSATTPLLDATVTSSDVGIDDAPDASTTSDDDGDVDGKLTLGTACASVATLGSPLALQYLSTCASMTFQLALLSRTAGADGATHVAAFGLGNVLCSMTGHAVLWGLGSGVDTLSSQAYGAGELDAIGRVFARAVVILWTCAAAPGTLAWANARVALEALGQEKDVAALAGRFALLRAPSLWAQTVTCCSMKTMLAMKRSKRVGVLSVVTTPFKFALPWLFLKVFGMGTVTGAAMALTAIDVSTMLCYLTGFLTCDEVRKALRGVRIRDAFAGWRGYLSLAVPGLAMSAIEWWSWDVNSLIAGMCADATMELESQTLLSNTYFVFYSIACVWQRGASSSIGNAVGAGKLKDSRTLSLATLTLSFACGVVCVIGFSFAADAVFAMFTDDETVARRLDALVPLVNAFILLDHMQVSVTGVIVGAGYQSVMTPVLVVAYWVIGLPLGAFLALGRPRLGLDGIWIALLVTAVIHLSWNLLVSFGGKCLPFAIRWRDAAERASVKLERERSSACIEEIATEISDSDSDSE
jgi:MATE family multidrug resistance protein